MAKLLTGPFGDGEVWHKGKRVPFALTLIVAVGHTAATILDRRRRSLPTHVY